MVTLKEFETRKEVVLKALASEEEDKSRKGGVDAPIADLISRINSHPFYFTTSSCSGRVSVFLEQSSAHGNSDVHRMESNGEGKARGKKGGDWIYVSHETADVDAVVLAVRRSYQEVQQEGLLMFRFEPFILALECCSLGAAQQLVTCAMASGFRESGISSMGKRIIVGVRSSIRLEVPIGEKGQLIVPEEYLRYLTASANKKFALNRQRIDRFLSTFIEQVDDQIAQPLQNVSESMKGQDSKVGHRRRNEMSLELQHKLLSSLEKRQSNILLKVNHLDAQIDPVHGVSKDGELSIAEGLGQSDMCSLFAASPLGSDGLLEKLFRWGHSACSNGEHSVIIFGGYGGPERHERLNDILELDFKKGCLRSLRARGTPAAMMAHTSSRVADSMVVIAGRNSPTCILSAVSVLDLKTLEWIFPEVTGAKFPPRHRHAAVLIGQKIYVYGGLDCSKILGDLHVLDTSSWTWSVIDCQGKLPSPRHSHSLAAIGTKLYLFGGREGNVVYGDLHVLDLKTCVWSEAKVEGIPPSPRFSHTMTAVGHFIAVIGGCPITKQGSDVVFLDVSSMSWVRWQMSLPRSSLLVRHSTTLIGDSLLVVGGGAACFAFGTSFSPSFVLNLKSFLDHVTYPINKDHSKVESCEVLPQEVTGDQEKRSWVLKVEKSKGKVCKDALKQLKWLDPSRKSRKLDQDTHLAFPILEVAVTFLLKDEHIEEASSLFHDSAAMTEVKNLEIVEDLRRVLACRGEVLKLKMPPETKHHSSPQHALQRSVSLLLEQNGVDVSLLEELPKRWERLGDMVVLPAGSLCSPVWSSLGEQLWRTVALSLVASRIARQAPVASAGTRDSRLQLLYGLDGWVEHRENGILYCFDATKCMFSSGNVSEKLRVASMQCQGATVVDLFAGIGYYVLPFLLKAGARRVYACEWNPHAIAALRHNLRVNGVEERCEVIEGDNQTTAPQGVADIVSLGLLPTSEGSWPVAVRALRPEGGILLVHENVKDTDEKAWIDYLLMSISTLAASLGRSWDISVLHFERVKWYAPHIRHVVADVRCKSVLDVSEVVISK